MPGGTLILSERAEGQKSFPLASGSADPANVWLQYSHVSLNDGDTF